MRQYRSSLPSGFARVFLSALVVVASMFIGQYPAQADSFGLDARAYAQAFGVDLAEATRRLQFQESAPELSELLMSANVEGYGGLWIEHVPAFRIVVGAVSGSEAAIARLVARSTLAGRVQIRAVNHSLARLNSDMMLLANLKGPFDMFVDLAKNRVEIRAETIASFNQFANDHGIQLPASARLIEQRRFVPINDIYGGLYADSTTGTDCTWGFSIYYNQTGERGITTAQHCGGSMYYLGTYLPIMGAIIGGAHDERWHSTSPHIPRNLIVDPNHPDGERPITARTFAINQTIGQWVCKYGAITGYNCGILQSKTVQPSACVPNAAPTYHLLHRDGVTLGVGGDSGGPVFYSNSAYGLLTCGNPIGEVLYIPTDTFEDGLNVTVLTYY